METLRQMVFSYAQQPDVRNEFKEFLGDQVGAELLQALGKDGVWVGDEFIGVAAKVLGRDIAVVQEKDGVAVVFMTTNQLSSENERIYIHYNGTNHYNAFVDVGNDANL
eukprot:TRINITY_DN5964_c0_g1_i1.p1 TRINITY_DN5964_c0_g1~~TRINITY_DN5964_c0_g1_i1.p1  ORF type:complete len:109 (+),score=4.91 TRINITY_DN5964_c0_g1_i1:2-328(+)